jgi:23S rRNA (cytidine1920-2'-O)/16S rRNA (cytidine1409-2'-O)-methyltransferase
MTKSFENDVSKSVDEANNCDEHASKRKKMRLDELCREQYPEFSRNVIQSFIAQGKVLVDGVPVLKAGAQIKPTASITVTGNVPKFVCRAGLKLEAAIQAFGIVPDSRVVLDAGLSTGGFTDCWIQYGAAHVFGIDVGYGQVAEKVRVHQSVTVMERTNLRHLRRSNLESHLQGKGIDLVSLDVSFISTLKMRDAICDIMEPQGDVVLLIKPQFEAGKQAVGAGGVVRDKSVHASVLYNVIHGWQDAGFRCSGLIKSPIKGATAGNIEYLCHLKRGIDNVAPDDHIHELLLELGLQQATPQ